MARDASPNERPALLFFAEKFPDFPIDDAAASWTSQRFLFSFNGIAITVQPVLDLYRRLWIGEEESDHRRFHLRSGGRPRDGRFE